MSRSAAVLLLVFAILGSACGLGMSSYQRNEPRVREYLDKQVGITKYDDVLTEWGEPYSVFNGDDIFIVTWSSEKVGPTVTVAAPIGNGAIVSTRQNRTGWKLSGTFDKKSRVFKTYIYEAW